MREGRKWEGRIKGIERRKKKRGRGGEVGKKVICVSGIRMQTHNSQCADCQ